MQVWMMNQGLTPRVQHAEKADLRAEALGVRRYLQQRGRSAAEQQIVQDALVLQHQLGELVRHGEHDMQIVHWDEFARTRRYPAVACQDLALGAMAIAAGVEGEAEILTALGAAITVAAERSGAAALDGAHDLMLRPGDAGTAALEEPVGEGAKDISHLESRPVHEAAGSFPVCPARSNICSGLGADFNFRVDRCR